VVYSHGALSLLRWMEVLWCSTCQHQFGKEAMEKGRRKVGCPFGDGCYSLLLHTSSWTVEDETRASARKPADLDGWWCTSACRVHSQVVWRSWRHQRVRHVDEIFQSHPSCLKLLRAKRLSLQTIHTGRSPRGTIHPLSAPLAPDFVGRSRLAGRVRCGRGGRAGVGSNRFSSALRLLGLAFQTRWGLRLSV
jgi:hypothetical protein